MKKLMFATALGVSAAAFAIGQAGPTMLNATSFEGYAADAAVVGAGGGDVGESGVGVNYFYYDGDSDASLVKAFGDVVAPAITRPYYWASSNNTQYLELSTEGGILWRSINAIDTTDGVSLGDAQQVAAEGIYLDTLVQFTPTEEGGAPELDPKDKLAIWLNVDSNQQTNLMVRAGFVDDDGTDTSQTPTTYTLTTASPVVPGQWYRLTVKVIADVTQQMAKNPLAYETGYTGFEIYLDSVLLAATTPAFGQGFIDLATDAGEFGWLDQTDDASLITYLQSGTVFPALGLPTTSATLQGVGFKGSGALDDIVWTEEDPFANAGGDAAWIDAVTEVFVGANLSQAEKTAIASWATANNITVAAGSEEIAAAAYLLNLTTLPGAVPELTITSIEEGAEAWTLTVAASDDGDPLALPASLNGVVTLTQSATLAGLSTATPATANFSIANGTATVTVAKDAAAAKFMKVGVGLAPAAPPANSGN